MLINKIYGYNYVLSGHTKNELGMEIVRFILQRFIEYIKSPPEDMVSDVIQKYRNQGEDISYEDAKAKVSLDEIEQLVLSDARQKWPDFFNASSSDTELEVVVDKELWEQVNVILRQRDQR